MLVRLSLVVLVLVLGAITYNARSTAPTATAAGDCTADGTLDTEERAFLVLINQHRAQNGRAPLGVSYMLSKAAQWKSNDLGVNAYFAHDDLNRTWVQRIRDCGYGYNTGLGENIAAGNSSALATFNQWKNSAGHNANMLSTGYATIGIGRAFVAGSPYSWYWTTEFGGFDDGYVTIAPSSPAQPVARDVALTWKRVGRDRYLLRASPSPGTSIARVEFAANGVVFAIDRRAPFTAIWRGRDVANVRFTAVAYPTRH
jgi:uncharacterized protein YkwD